MEEIIKEASDRYVCNYCKLWSSTKRIAKEHLRNCADRPLNRGCGSCIYYSTWPEQHCKLNVQRTYTNTATPFYSKVIKCDYYETTEHVATPEEFEEMRRTLALRLRNRGEVGLRD